jgi:hypothetical protein
LKRCLRAAIGLVVLIGLGSGCGSEPEVPASKVDLNKVGGNQRLQEPKQDYKQLIGKDGKFQAKPGKNPPKSGG